MMTVMMVKTIVCYCCRAQWCKVWTVTWSWIPDFPGLTLGDLCCETCATNGPGTCQDMPAAAMGGMECSVLPVIFMAAGYNCDSTLSDFGLSNLGMEEYSVPEYIAQSTPRDWCCSTCAAYDT